MTVRSQSVRSCGVCRRERLVHPPSRASTVLKDNFLGLGCFAARGLGGLFCGLGLLFRWVLTLLFLAIGRQARFLLGSGGFRACFALG